MRTWKVTIVCGCGETSSESGEMCLNILLEKLTQQIIEEILESGDKHVPKKILIEQEGR